MSVRSSDFQPSDSLQHFLQHSNVVKPSEKFQRHKPTDFKPHETLGDLPVTIDERDVEIVDDSYKTFLKNLGGYIVDRTTGKEGLSMAGLMMFGKGLSVQERFANFRMDYIDFCNLIGDERYSDRLTYDGRWENNL